MKMFIYILIFFLSRFENVFSEKLNYLKRNSSADSNNYKNESKYLKKEFDEFYYTNQIAKNYVWTTVPIVFLILGYFFNLHLLI